MSPSGSHLAQSLGLEGQPGGISGALEPLSQGKRAAEAAGVQDSSGWGQGQLPSRYCGASKVGLWGRAGDPSPLLPSTFLSPACLAPFPLPLPLCLTAHLCLCLFSLFYTPSFPLPLCLSVSLSLSVPPSFLPHLCLLLHLTLSLHL